MGVCVAPPHGGGPYQVETVVSDSRNDFIPKVETYSIQFNSILYFNSHRATPTRGRVEIFINDIKHFTPEGMYLDTVGCTDCFCCHLQLNWVSVMGLSLLSGNVLKRVRPFHGLAQPEPSLALSVSPCFSSCRALWQQLMTGMRCSAAQPFQFHHVGPTYLS